MRNPFKNPVFSTLHIWAFRNVLRRPLESLLMAFALTLTITCVGTLLLFPRAVYDTADQLLNAAPAIIVRQVDATGWRPLPIQPALEAARDVVGVVSARPRVWAVVNGPQGPLTIFGVEKEVLPDTYAPYLARAPDRGQAIVGPGVVSSQIGGDLTLEGAHQASFKILGRLPDETSIFAHDLVLLNILDARQLTGLSQGYASDLAINVFHEEEQEAILSDLTAAFPFQVRCITRRESAGIYASGLNRRGALGALILVPAVLAVSLLVTVNIRKSMGRQSELGIMKAMGWTTADIIRLQLYRELSVCLPAAVIGVWLSFLMVYWPGATWLGKIFFGWEALPPKLYLDPRGAFTVLLEVAGFILAPVIASAFAPAIKGATADVLNLIQGAGSR